MSMSLASRLSALKRPAVGLIATALLSGLLPQAALAIASVTITPATGGSAISADTAATGGTGAFTGLTGPSIAETAAGQIGAGTFIITLPAGYEFRTSGTVVASLAAVGGGACVGLSVSGVTMTSSDATVTLSGASGAACALTYVGFAVRPTVGTPLARAGSITTSGGATVTGISSGSTSLGAIAEAAGAPILTFQTQPSLSTVAGVAFLNQPVVQSEDKFGNVRSGDVVTLAIKSGTGASGAILTCTSNQVATAGSGLATFVNCSIEKAGTGYVLRATASGAAAVDSQAFAITVGAAAKLGFVVLPARAVPNLNFGIQPVLAIQDAAGNTVTTAPSTLVSISLLANPTVASFTCNANTVSTNAGLATFSACRINKVGIGYTLTATAPGLTSVTSALFDVSDRLAFTTQPVGAVGGLAFTTQPVVVVRAGTTATAVDDQSTQVLLSLVPGTGTSGATLTCTANPVTVVSGVATFNACRIDKLSPISPANPYFLIASATPLSSATSTSLPVVAGAATQLGFTTQPSATAAAATAFPVQPVVTVQDAGGNTITTGAVSTSLVALSLAYNVTGATLTCTGATVRAAVAGVATFTGCSIDRPGVYQIQAIASGLSTATSNLVTVGAVAAQITLSATPMVLKWGQSSTWWVQFADHGANRVVTIQRSFDNVTWSLFATLTTNSAGYASLTYTPPTNAWFKASFAGTPDLSAGTSNTIRVLVRELSYLRPTNLGTIRSIRAGTSIPFVTIVRPLVVGQPPVRVTYVVYRNVGGIWTLFTRRDVYTDSTGRAYLTWHFGTRGLWYVRSIANSTSVNSNSFWSPVERYSVF